MYSPDVYVRDEESKVRADLNSDVQRDIKSENN